VAQLIVLVALLYRLQQQTQLVSLTTLEPTLLVAVVVVGVPLPSRLLGIRAIRLLLLMVVVVLVSRVPWVVLLQQAAVMAGWESG
jgi:hypothetical protein